MKFSEFKEKLFTRIASKLYMDLDKNIDNTVFLSGVGRSGTTWIAQIINYQNDYRELFEPFLPTRVPEAKIFDYYQYFRASNDKAELIAAAENILSGKLRQKWIDQNNRGFVFRKRLVKDIRTNMMLYWLRAHFPQMPIILLIRHPFAVANSWVKLKWGIELDGKASIIDRLMEQTALMDDFPIIKNNMEALGGIQDSFDLALFNWCVQNYVPLKQFADKDLFITFYENYIIEPQSEVDRLFAYLGKSYEPVRMNKVIHRPSLTNFNKTDFKSQEAVLNGWKKKLSPDQQQRGQEILRAFGLDKLYNENSEPNPQALEAARIS
ncbi:MAG: sulfotransferase domain-containing protein [Bacteroidota bacterium]